jgi:hypothetical protein
MVVLRPAAERQGGGADGRIAIIDMDRKGGVVVINNPRRDAGNLWPSPSTRS